MSSSANCAERSMKGTRLQSNTAARVPMTSSTRSSNWLVEPKKNGPPTSTTRTPPSRSASASPAPAADCSSRGSGHTRRLACRVSWWMISIIDSITPAPTATIRSTNTVRPKTAPMTITSVRGAVRTSFSMR